MKKYLPTRPLSYSMITLSLLIGAIGLWHLSGPEPTTSVHVEATVSNATLSRHNDKGHAVLLSATRLRQQIDGSIHIEDIHIEAKQMTGGVILDSKKGEIDAQHERLTLNETIGQLGAKNDQINLLLASASYRLSDGQLTGKKVILTTTNKRLSGDNFVLQAGGQVRLKGNVHAVFTPTVN